MINYYTLLEVSQKASKEQIKEAYKRISVRVHPDKNGGDEYYTEIFKTVNEAREILTDEAKRAEYDEKLKRSFSYSSDAHNYTGTNLRLNKKWIFPLAAAAGFLILVILLPSSDLKQLPQQPLAELNSSDLLIKKADKIQKQVEPKPVIGFKNETGVFEGKANKASQKLPEPQPAIPAVNRPGQPIREENKAPQSSVYLQSTIKPAPTAPLTTFKAAMNNQPQVQPTPAAIKPSAMRLNEVQMMEILDKVNILKAGSNNKINCIKIRKTKSSNVENAFDMAFFLKSRGFVISGRETVNYNVRGAEVNGNEQCFFVTIGSY